MLAPSRFASLTLLGMGALQVLAQTASKVSFFQALVPGGGVVEYRSGYEGG